MAHRQRTHAADRHAPVLNNVVPISEHYKFRDPRRFALLLNKCLDEMGAPLSLRDRAQALSKMSEISRLDAIHLLEGHSTWINDDVIRKVANELEINLHHPEGE